MDSISFCFTPGAWEFFYSKTDFCGTPVRVLDIGPIHIVLWGKDR